MKVQHLDHLNMTVTSLEATCDWYGRVLGFEEVERGTSRGIDYRIVRSGEALLCLYERPDLGRRPGEMGAPGPVHGLSHFAVRIEGPEEWEATVEREGVEVLYGGRVEWPKSVAWYVRDPDNYEIEVAWWREGASQF